MRIAQVIDSLEVGGAERMAVNYANALLNKTGFSGLVVTRKEGPLKNDLHQSVGYCFLDKKSTIDRKAVLRLLHFCKSNKITHLQPHSSSYFTAFLVKLLAPGIQIIWHDHNGLSEFLGSGKWMPLKIASFFFKGIVVVNYQLKNWAEKELYCKHVLYLPNFTNIEQKNQETILHGISGKRILCVANLRDQKNHFLLLRVAKIIKEIHPLWTFHLVGKDFNDAYSAKLNEEIISMELSSHVFLYGTKSDTGNIIAQSDIAILTSKSEGLPVALLEYGLLKKPVVVTQVGEIPLIIKNKVNGFIVASDDADAFAVALLELIADETLRNAFGAALYETISENNSEQAVLSKYLNWLKEI